MPRSKTRVKRKGIATTECALCLPVIVVLTMGVIETCSVLFLKEAVTIAAYEGARVGIQRGSTNELVKVRIKDVLNGRGIKYDSDNAVSFSDPGFDTAADLQHVTTNVVVPCSGNTVIGWFFAGRSVEANVTMRKEFMNPS